METGNAVNALRKMALAVCCHEDEVLHILACETLKAFRRQAKKFEHALRQVERLPGPVNTRPGRGLVG